MNEKPIISPIQDIPDLSKETPESVQTRVQNCIKEVEAVLLKYHCTFQVQQGITIAPLQVKN